MGLTFGKQKPPAAPPQRLSVFSSLRWGKPVSNPNDFVPLFNDSVGMASSRTQEYLLFVDPEDKFQPSPSALNEIFLMTYISQSTSLHMTNSFNCTAMTPEQRILLGADWVWAVLEKPTKNPRIQIAVQILHPPERGGSGGGGGGGDGGGGGAGWDEYPTEMCTETMHMAQMVSSHRTMPERMVDFCASIGKDCYALFLLFGRKNDPGNIYGVLSNNFDAAIGKCTKIDRALIENFLKGSRYLHTPTGMLQAVLTKKDNEPLTLLIKFT